MPKCARCYGVNGRAPAIAPQRRDADREQLLRCYPEFPEFLRRKRAWDPAASLSSDWYQHYNGLLS
jgi:hypothetical protein